MSSFADRYKKLNQGQKKAVDTIYGPVLVIAGPGSGKTELLGMRTANILKETDVLPQNILCLTFTESAAENMRKRLIGLIGKDAYKVAIHTFHGFGSSIIRRYPEDFFNNIRLEPADEMTKLQVLQSIFEELPLQKQLSSYHPDHGGYIYLKDAASCISNIRRAGLSPTEFRSTIQNNLEYLAEVQKGIPEAFAPRLSMKTIAHIDEFLSKIPSGDVPAHDIIKTSLAKALMESADQQTTKPVSKWKSAYLQKDEKNEYVLKDIRRCEKMLELADVYEQYQSEMKKRGFFDFDDMILEVINNIQSNKTLQYNIQEQYQFILVDEFQDTSGAQLKLLNLITNEDANILAVGDDDQAIFSFQGAELQNLIQFTKTYKDVTFVTLAQNYRSSQKILDFAQSIIHDSSSRMQHFFDEIEKDLESMKSGEMQTDITFTKYQDAYSEAQEIANNISVQIQSGIPAKDIAVITRKNSDLIRMSQALNERGVPVSFERESNIFDDDIVSLIIKYLFLVQAYQKKDIRQMNVYLSEILSNEIYQIPDEAYWDLSLTAHETRTNWLSLMRKSEHETIQILAANIQQLLKRSHDLNIEALIDVILSEGDWSIRNMFFSDKIREQRPATYYDHLSALQTFIGHLRGVNDASLEKIIEYIEFHLQNEIRIKNVFKHRDQQNAVSLFTAHKAKGLEFPHVYIIHANLAHWKTKGIQKLSFPSFLPLSPKHDDDELIRLLFVAATRAESHLHFSYYRLTDTGKEVLPFPYIDEQLANENSEVHRPIVKNDQTQALISDHKNFLAPILEKYVLSVTHLNNFLDVTKGGPQYFFEKNLLRFPQGRSPSGMYGSIIHDVLQMMYMSDTLLEKGEINDRINTLFDASAFSKKEAIKYKKSADIFLESYYDYYVTQYKNKGICEKDIKNIYLDDIPLSGKIDRIIFHEDEKRLEVVDFKTRKAISSWSKGSPTDKIKTHQFRQQLLFYYLLIDQSREYTDWKTESGLIEFVQGDTIEGIHTLKTMFASDEIEHLKKLIHAIHKKIMQLDFPSVDHYEQSIKGIQAFERDLIEGNI